VAAVELMKNLRREVKDEKRIYEIEIAEGNK